MLLDVMTRVLAVLFASRWDSKFPDFPWQNDAASGRLLVDGVHTEYVDLGSLTAERGERVVVPSAELLGKLTHNDELWIEGEQFKVVVVAGRPFQLSKRFPFAGGDYAAKRAVVTQVLPSLTNRNGNPIDRHILSKLRRGDTKTWDMTAFSVALLGSSIELLPRPPAVILPTSSPEEKQARHVDNIRILKNTLLSHPSSGKAAMDTAVFNAAQQQMEDCITMCSQDQDERASFQQELEDVCFDIARGYDAALLARAGQGGE